MLRTLLIALALSVSAVLPATAQDTAAAPAESAAVAAPMPTTTPAVQSPTPAESGPVAVPEPSEKAVRYHRSGNVLWIVSTLWGLLVPALLLFTGLSARIRTLAYRIGRKWFFALFIYLVILAVLVWLVDLPLAYYSGFVRQHQYGLSNQTFGKWMGDSLKALALGALTAPLALWVPYLLIRKSPRRWWLYSSLAAIPALVFVIWVSPVVVDPMFNRFGPMKDKALEAQILATASRAGIEGGRVYEVAKSEDTNALNAYVNGFGSSKRIVLWDTLLEKMDDREVLFVMGHEMGHYVLGHVRNLLVIAILLTLLALYTVHRTSGALIARYRRRFGFDELGDFASYPLLILIIGVLGLVLSPLLLAVTRHQEHESDRFGLELLQDNRAAAGAFVKLQQQNLAVPHPGTIYKLWRSSHPPLGERIEFANEYRPWETGQPLKYGEKFEKE